MLGGDWLEHELAGCGEGRVSIADDSHVTVRLQYIYCIYIYIYIYIHTYILLRRIDRVPVLEELIGFQMWKLGEDVEKT